jgi:hypothetical protein
MTTIEKLNKIATELFKREYIYLNRSESQLVFKHYLANNAVSVQPNSRSYNGYINLKNNS